MLKTLIKLFDLLDRKQKLNLIFLQLLIIFMVILEILSIFALGQYIILISNPGNFSSNTVFQKINIFVNFTDETHFVVFFTFLILLIILFSTIFSIYTLWKLSMYGAKIGVEIGIKLFNFYLTRDWLYHTKNNSNSLINKILQESGRVNSAIIQPFMHMNAKVILAIGLITSIFFYNFWASLNGILVFSFAYTLLYLTVRRNLYINGEIISATQSDRLKHLSESFGGIKDILLYNLQNFFKKKFTSTSNRYAFSYGITQVLMAVPRYIIEFVAIVFLTSLTLYIVFFKGQNILEILPFMTVFAFAALKILPSFQQIYSSVSSIKANIPAFENIEKEMSLSSLINFEDNFNKETNKKIIFKDKVLLKNIDFSYGNINVLKNINLEIKNNSMIGVAGASGCGKSTLMDILLGLLKPSNGSIMIDHEILTDNNIRIWQNSLGFVSQNIFLKDSSILENIAFGIDKKNINYDLINKVIQMSNLDHFINELPNGYHTMVGERGIQLSGGQKQRVGIARALYQDSEFLIFDEATSSLDMISEKEIINSIDMLSGKKTIIIVAHRLVTLKNCNLIYLMDKGKIIDEGDYEYLISNNNMFQEMSKNLKLK